MDCVIRDNFTKKLQKNDHLKFSKENMVSNRFDPY